MWVGRGCKCDRHCCILVTHGHWPAGGVVVVLQMDLEMERRALEQGFASDEERDRQVGWGQPRGVGL